MGWCLDCHRDPYPRLRPLVGGHQHDLEAGRRSRRGRAQSWRSSNDVKPRTSCYTCHRTTGHSCSIYGPSRVRPARPRPAARSGAAPTSYAGARTSPAGRVPRRRTEPPAGRRAPQLPAGAGRRGRRWPASPPASRRGRRWSPSSAPRPTCPRASRNAYATAASRGGYGIGVVVTSWEGRPTKMEGNREHPASLGATDAMLQAEVLDLYDPHAARGFRRGGRHLGRIAPARGAVGRWPRGHEQGPGAPAPLPGRADQLADAGRAAQPHPPALPAGPLRLPGRRSPTTRRAPGRGLAFGRPLDASWPPRRGRRDPRARRRLPRPRRRAAPRQAREYAARRRGRGPA